MATGLLQATETGADSAALAGSAPVAGVLAATETGADSAALVGSTPTQVSSVGHIDLDVVAEGFAENAAFRIEKDITPGIPGTPGDPGQPWIPAYTSTETKYVCNQVADYDLLPVTRIRYSGPPSFIAEEYTDYELVIVGFHEECGNITYTVHHPEQPYIPPTPGTPDVPPDLHLGWQHGARAGPYAGNIVYTFKASPAITGAVTGLTPAHRDTGYGYLEIDYGLHFAGGYVRVMEAGTPITGFFAYTLDDVFRIERRGRFITYRKNAEVLLESLVPDADVSAAMAVDLSMYAGGDQIWDAQVTETPLDGYGTGDASLPALWSIGADQPINYGDAWLPALVVTGSGHGVNVGDAELPQLHALGGNHAVGQATDQVLPALTSYGESGYLAPGVPNYGDAWLPPLMAGGLLLVGGVGTGDAELPQLHALGGDHQFGQATDQVLPALVVTSFQYVDVDGVISAYGPESEWTIYGSSPGLNEALIGGPGMAIEGGGANAAVLGGPGMAIEADGEGSAVGTLELGGLGIAITAEGTGSVLGTAVLGGPGMAIEGGGANAAVLGGPGMAIEAEGNGGAAGWAVLGGPGMSIEALGAGAIVGEVTLGGPGMVLQAWDEAGADGAVVIGWPLMYFAAEGSGPGATAVTYAVNLRAAETLRYDAYTFDRIIRFHGKHYGLRADGLYLLEGDTDAGAAIDAYLRIHPSDIGTQKQKRVPYLYLGTEDPVAVTAYVDGAEIGTFGEYHGARRVKLPRGPKGRYWAYKVANVAGGDLRLDGYEPQVEVLSRKV